MAGHDYAAGGVHHLTLCTADRQPIFGAIENGMMRLNRFGWIVLEEIRRSPEIRVELALDRWAIMPDHLHILIFILPVGAHGSASGTTGTTNPTDPINQTVPISHGIAVRRPRSVSSFVAGLKAVTTRRINEQRIGAGGSVWQRNFYERRIRSIRELWKVRKYIADNVAKGATYYRRKHKLK